MWGRVRGAAMRIGVGATVEAFGVMHSYDPSVIAGALAIGMGAAAGLGGTGGGAAGKALDLVTEWGERERRRYERLPRKVLVLVTGQDVRRYRWPTSRDGDRVAHWPAGSYRAEKVKSLRELSVRVTLSTGSIALLTGPDGIGRRQTTRVVAAIMNHQAS